MPDDLDPISELQGRLAHLETSLTHIRQGKAPPKKVDLLSWRAANTNMAPAPTPGWRPPSWRLDAITRSLRENWIALGDIFRNWATRVEERFGR